MTTRPRILALAAALVLAGVVGAATPAAAAATPHPSTPKRVYGVTIDSVASIGDIVTALRRHSARPTVRVVFDEFVSARHYARAVARIDPVANIMGEILDSSAMSRYSVAAFRSRVDRYLDRLSGQVDIWEIGNEVNGDWLGRTADTVSKMTYAYDAVEARGGTTALTLYYNQGCSGDAAHEMFTWTGANVPGRMKRGLDYVWVSYYEDDCHGLQPDWQQVFDRLHAMFPHSRLGIGECGTTVAARKAPMIDRYYGMHVTTPGFVGGYFWWYYRRDAVPYTKSLWSRLDAWFR